jgi:two-component system LytT family sensor kinase
MNQIFNSGILKVRWVQHVLFWVSIILFFTFLYGSFNDDYDRQFLVQLLYLPFKAISAYTTIYVLMPRYFFKQQFAKFILSVVVLLFVGGVFHWWLALHVERPLFYEGEDWGVFWNFAKIIKSATYIFPYVLAALSIKFLKYWFREQRKTQEIIQGQMETELKFLKNQLNPHFLFNTLNNLYALTLKKSDLAPELVLKLSSLMDYMLYECDVERIALEKEVSFMENYLEIEKLRFGKRLSVEYQKTGSAKGKAIAPLIFLPFLENAFKHGASANLENTQLNISLTVEESSVCFEIYNSKDEPTQNANGENGIGLKNGRRRLELLYPNQHTLNIEDEEAYYKVTLTLQDV